MRVIKKSEVREIIIGHVEFTLIFLFDDFLFKIAILEPLKVRFLDKKQKHLSDDGNIFSWHGTTPLQKWRQIIPYCLAAYRKPPYLNWLEVEKVNGESYNHQW